jgi:hypothetical protein
MTLVVTPKRDQIKANRARGFLEIDALCLA